MDTHIDSPQFGNPWNCGSRLENNDGSQVVRLQLGLSSLPRGDHRCVDFDKASSGRHESLMAPDPTFRPSAKQLAQVVPAQFLIPAIVFAAAQIYLARLTAPAATAIAFIASLAVFIAVLCWITFLRNASVTVGQDGEVTVVDCRGRRRSKAPPSPGRLALLSI